MHDHLIHELGRHSRLSLILRKEPIRTAVQYIRPSVSLTTKNNNICYLHPSLDQFFSWQKNNKNQEKLEGEKIFLFLDFDTTCLSIDVLSWCLNTTTALLFYAILKPTRKEKKTRQSKKQSGFGFRLYSVTVLTKTFLKSNPIVLSWWN